MTVRSETPSVDYDGAKESRSSAWLDSASSASKRSRAEALQYQASIIHCLVSRSSIKSRVGGHIFVNSGSRYA